MKKRGKDKGDGRARSKSRKIHHPGLTTQAAPMVLPRSSRTGPASSAMQQGLVSCALNYTAEGDQITWTTSPVSHGAPRAVTLSALHLAGYNVEIILDKRNTTNGKGRITGPRIEYTHPTTNLRCEELIEKFVKDHVHTIPKGKTAWEMVQICARGNDLDGCLLSDLRTSKNLPPPKIVEQLSKEIKPKSLSQFHDFLHKNVPIKSELYRVCRVDEEPSEGLSFKQGSKILDPKEFFHDMINHVRNGSRSSLPFISMTTDLNSALWWSGFGILPLAKISTSEALDEGANLWDVVNHELIAGPGYNYGNASKEIVASTPLTSKSVSKMTITWKARSPVYLTDKDKKKAFPSHKEMTPDNITVLEQLQGTTRPFLVEIEMKDKDTKVKRKFVLKRGGRNVYASEHTANEFFAQTMYICAGVPYPHAALYSISMEVDGETMERNIMLSEYIEGVHLDSKTGLTDSVKKDVQSHGAMDIAVANFDVIGHKASNLICQGNTGKIFRLDAGAALNHKPDGAHKKHLFNLTDASSQLQKDIVDFTNANSKESADQLRMEVWKKVKSEDIHKQADRILTERNFKSTIVAWLINSKVRAGKWWQLFQCVHERLLLMQCSTKIPKRPMGSLLNRFKRSSLAWPHTSTQASSIEASLESASPTTTAATPANDQEIKVVSTRAKKQIEKLESEGYEIINVTSKAVDKYKALSPFIPTNESIQVPGYYKNGKVAWAKTVEGIWQGLKVFEKEGADIRKFSNATGKNLKRSVRKFGKVVGHHYQSTPTATPVYLSHVDAKRQIYVPAYKKQLQHETVKRLIDELRTKPKIAFRDYFTNGVCEKGKPLSHAVLLKTYLKEGAAGLDRLIDGGCVEGCTTHQ